MDFADSFSQTYRGAGVGTGSTSNSDPIQVGTGVISAAIKNQFTQGAIARTGPQTDLALSGDGFFMVKEPIAVLGLSNGARAGLTGFVAGVARLGATA